MKKAKTILKRILFPPKVITFMLTLLSAAALVYIFENKMENTFAAYAAYVISFYTLCAVVAGIPFYYKKYKDKLYNNPYTAKYLTEKELRIKVSMVNGTVFNFVYAALKLMAGIYFRSVWIGAVALYYILLFVIKLLLLGSNRAQNKAEDKKTADIIRWKSCRLCASLMFVLNVAITSMAVQMIWQNKGYSYPGLLIYAMAAYTFYRLIMSAVQFVKLRKNVNPIFTSVKAVDLSVALVSLFALQTAMFAAFGAEMSRTAQLILNCFTGGLVCITVLFIAVMMVINSNNKLSQIKRNKEML